MVLPFRRSLGAFIFALAAMIAAAQPELATAKDRGTILSQVQNACIVGHRFEPGPIAGGRDRQPTVSEYQARVQELGESKLRDAYSCAELPVGS